MSVTLYKLWKYKTTFTEATHRHRKCEKFRLGVTRKQGLKIVLGIFLYIFENVLHKIADRQNIN
jgi:hypothetical protein